MSGFGFGVWGVGFGELSASGCRALRASRGFRRRLGGAFGFGLDFQGGLKAVKG